MADAVLSSLQAGGLKTDDPPIPGTTTSKEVEWYSKDLPDLAPAIRELLENYSHVPATEVNSHVLKFRDLAWYVNPYPCIGLFHFLDLSLSRHQSYGSIVGALKGGATLLDLGCCVAQDLRKLVFDGAPVTNVWGADLEPKFFDLSYDLFLDKDHFDGRFIAADIFDEGCLGSLRGDVDIVHAALFLHLWSWDLQLKACVAIVRILKPEAGVRVLGQQMATTEPGHMIAGHRTVYKHNDESFKRLWDEVGVKTGTKWKVNARLDDGDGISVGVKKWDTNTARRLVFEAERL